MAGTVVGTEHLEPQKLGGCFSQVMQSCMQSPVLQTAGGEGGGTGVFGTWGGAVGVVLFGVLVGITTLSVHLQRDAAITLLLHP